ncbi:MAG: peptide deformylase [Anaerolineales bacterium]|nr:peptide deformylase [Anaerolineales bacterium]
MAVREVVCLPEEVLRKKARKISEFNAGFQTLADDMVETMRLAPGVGLAAPQVDVSQRLIVVEYGEEEDEEAPKKLYVVANPEIVYFSEEQVMGIEGCLSIPGFAGEVLRAKEVVVKGQNRKGKPIKIKARDWLARIFQHEIDHLDGVLYIDRSEKVWKMEEEPDSPIPIDC